MKEEKSSHALSQLDHLQRPLPYRGCDMKLSSNLFTGSIPKANRSMHTGMTSTDLVQSQSYKTDVVQSQPYRTDIYVLHIGPIIYM